MGSSGHGSLTNDLRLYSTSLSGYSRSDVATEFLFHVLIHVRYFTLMTCFYTEFTEAVRGQIILVLT